MNELIAGLSAGDILQLPVSTASTELVNFVSRELTQLFGNDFRHRRHGDNNELFMEKTGALRQQLATSVQLRDIIVRLIAELDLQDERILVDTPRLRAVSPQSADIARAAAAFYAHRDCWYANPDEQVNLWIPLHDVSAAESFEIYPDCYHSAIPNNSAAFDLDKWQGFQNPDHSGMIYPRALSEPVGRVHSVAGNAGSRLLFNGSHLHRTLKPGGERIRYSLDLRIVVDSAEFTCPDNHCHGRLQYNYMEGAMS